MTAPAIDLTTMDKDAIRALIKQGRQVLCNRHLIPDDRLSKRTATGLTDSDLAKIRRAARRFEVHPVALAEEIIALRSNPQIVKLQSREGDTVCLTPLVRVHWTTRVGTALTGNGHLCRNLAYNYVYDANNQAAPGEYITIEPCGIPEMSENGYSFKRLLGPGFIQAWNSLTEFPTTSALKVILETAGHYDTPQEAMLTWLLRIVSQTFHVMEEQGILINALLGYHPKTLILASLIRPALAAVREGQNPQTFIGNPSYDGVWYHKLLRATELFLINTNLITPNLETDPVLEVPLSEIWERYKEQEQLANLKAGQLRAAVVERFGFQEIQYKSEKAWVRTVPPIPDGHSWYQTEQVIKKQPHVLITERCRIYINDQYRCVVEAKSADLPHADQVVRRLLAVATSHRERIHTLKNDLPLLEELFADVKDAHIWDLISDEVSPTSTITNPAKDGTNPTYH